MRGGGIGAVSEPSSPLVLVQPVPELPFGGVGVRAGDPADTSLDMASHSHTILSRPLG
ncbi:hypothetical protein SAV14893_004660 [Streptomyces avermitilis]|uniref:Uncharacterized protein n=2 Tax=Streptomyces avermitilis TaxID=33903 RepID=Q82NC6_STRAW|nr:hypothetical protein SAVERM_1377 [Streptomyces avermitilis MA-4680 = NBRC 14893]BBJ49029.1 hypothetical protein SAVMC3_16580 [Streptomyces avermitilis]GDY61073.1 hypothetical protein SAV14893_004660 [Streptomyces avermitilis]GDY78850.1 hypothetical protein SAV31267_083350 [Streptomyces avermitilis]GDY87668.1 hypothetical protein SAVCW2_68670 [Streptomyces avermitilis]